MVANYVASKNRLFELGQHQYHTHDPRDQKQKLVPWEKIDEFPIAVDYLAEEYDMKPIDLATPGTGNKQIYQKIVDHILQHREKVGLVIICWSSFRRLDFELEYPKVNGDTYQSIVYPDYDTEKSREYIKKDFPVWHELYKIGNIFPKRDIDDFYRYSCMLDALCKAYDIPCMQCASIVTFPFSNKQKKIFLDHPLLLSINRIDFYGWPMFQDLGGDHLYSMNDKEHIRPWDSHPNAYGQRNIANKLSKFIRSRGLI